MEPSDKPGTGDKRNAFDELESRIEDALEDLRPKLKQMADGLGERVNTAREEAQPRLDQFIAGIQPRIDTLLQKMQAGLEDVRKDFEERAARAREGTGSAEPASTQTTPIALPPVADNAANTAESPFPPTDPPLM